MKKALPNPDKVDFPVQQRFTLRTIMPFRFAPAVALALWLAAGKTKADTTTSAAEDARVTEAKKILADYQAGAPRNHRVLHVVYFCPGDRTPAPDYQARLERVLGDISQFYSEQVRHYDLPFDGIPLDKDAAGHVIIHLVQGTRQAGEYSEARSFGQIRQDVRKVLAGRSEEHTSELQSLRHIVCR